MLRSLETSGLPARHAETLTRAILDAVDAQAKLQENALAIHGERERITFSSSFEQLRTELRTQQTTHQSFVAHELERLRAECEKLRSELKTEKEKTKVDLKYEVDKLVASQRLDLNLERGRIRDDLVKQNDRIQAIDVRLDKEVLGLRTLMETGKNDLLRYSVATIVAGGGLALGWLRLMM